MPVKKVTQADKERGARMLALREEAGLTQEEIDRTRTTVLAVEKGRNKLSGGELLGRYAKAFGVSQEEIVRYRDGQATIEQVLRGGATSGGMGGGRPPVRPSRKAPLESLPAPGTGTEEVVELRELQGWENAISEARQGMGGDDEDFHLAGFVRLPRLPARADAALAKAVVLLLQGYCRGSGVRQRVAKR